MRLLPLLLLPALCSAELSFNRDVRPILSKNCLSCHGPDEEDRKGDFHLDTFEGITKENDEGLPGILIGDPDASEVIRRVTSQDADEVMPPGDHGKPLTREEIQTLRQWIKEGAPYEAHWALQRPHPGPPPSSSHPEAKNPIDHFVAARLATMGLEPAPGADPRILLRRLSLDLTGLPPTLEEVEAFAADPSEESYQKAIDRYLDSPAYGEHMAGKWLDIARYADTVGYSGDEERIIWPWRDWVIEACNSNMPFDQFTIEQLAGDLLPGATEQQILATAFHRNTLNNNEGGTNDEEFRTIAVKDRISTTVNAWMGLTMRCAECHTHKYDPISHKEYYQFYAFFNQTEDDDKRDDRPRLDVMPKGREQEMRSIQAKIESLGKQRDSRPDPWSGLRPTRAISSGGSTLTIQDDDSLIVTGRNPRFDTYELTLVSEYETRGIRLELLPSRESNDHVGRSDEGAMVLSQFAISTSDADGGTLNHKITHASADHSQANHEVTNLIGPSPHERGWAIKHPQDGYRARRVAVFSLEDPIPAGTPMTVRMIHQSQWPKRNIGRFRLSSTATPKPAEQFEKLKLDPLGREIAALEKQLLEPVRVPVLRERKTPRETRMMLRGSFLQPGEKVEAKVPAAFDFFPENGPDNRLGVARWLMAPENPLTARVAVNRLWAGLFGMGLVETEEDFGIQGIPPSHPRLLDWLAIEYQKTWNTKRLLKLIVSSHTYRQSAIAESLQLEKDPRNVFLSRGPRHRLSAEVVRDSALAVTGLLSRRLYGAPVYPPNPIKKYVNAFTGGMTWTDSVGEDRYRRALYTFLKRSSPHPLFETFDMATREVCNLRRIRTNTPLQSFMTLNDPAFIEAAQALARIMHEHATELDDQLSYGIRKALLRPANAAQIEALRDLYRETFETYQSDTEAAHTMAGTLKPGSSAAALASLTVVANVILNQDAFLTK